VIRRASVEDVEAVNDWLYRDMGYRPDFTDFLSDRHNVCLIEGNGGALFVWRGPGIYEVHVFFEQRGREVLRISREMLEVMRRDHGAQLFWAAVPITSRHVIMFTRLMGWKSQGFSDFPQGRCELFIGE
jgi:hypothetical protein